MFEVKQKVWCAIYGAGIVKRIRQESGVKYPVVVLFNSNIDDENFIVYTSDGRYTVDGNATLFPYPVEIVEAVTKNLCEELKHLLDEVKTLREALKTCPSKPQELKPSIDWSHVSEAFQYLAMDSDGRCWLWATKPAPFQEQWRGGGSAVKAENFSSFISGTCDWEDSLIERPN